MSNIINKMLNFVGLDEQEETEQGELYEENISQPEFSSRTSSKKSKVVNIHATTQLQVVVIQPETFDETQDIADHFKSKKPVVINLELLEKDIARRVIDFLSGTVYALDGSIQKVASDIFLIAPYNVNIMGDFKDELRSKGVFPWSL